VVRASAGRFHRTPRGAVTSHGRDGTAQCGDRSQQPPTPSPRRDADRGEVLEIGFADPGALRRVHLFAAVGAETPITEKPSPRLRVQYIADAVVTKMTYA